MTDNLYQKFVKHWEEVTEVPPQNLGVLTPYYKFLASRLKDYPWVALILTGLLTVAALYFLLGSAIVAVTSLLQRGI